jgi:hypothetical protein
VATLAANLTGLTISKAVVSLNQSASVMNKIFDGTTNSTLNQSGTFVVQLGNAAAANGSLANITQTTIATSVAGEFNQSAAGTGLTANVTYQITDTANYSFAGGVPTQTGSVAGLTITGNTSNSSASTANIPTTFANTSTNQIFYETHYTPPLTMSQILSTNQMAPESLGANATAGLAHRATNPLTLQSIQNLQRRQTTEQPLAEGLVACINGALKAALEENATCAKP